MAANPEIATFEHHADRVLARLDALARHSEEPGRITRPYGTPALKAAMNDVAAWMSGAGIAVHHDAIGNVRGQCPGQDPHSPALLLGSHLDSVRNAGRFDGPLGIVLAIEVIEYQLGTGRLPPVTIEVVGFADEEGMRFQTAYLGSRALAGRFDSRLLDLRDAVGISLRDAIVAFGGDPDAIDSAALDTGAARGYVEVHIEQGPILESLDAPVGVVTGIAGQSRLAVAFHGAAGHAGTVPPHLRRDALPAAAELVLAVEREMRQTPGLVATVGRVDVEPGVSNVVPGSVRLTLDVRHARDESRTASVARLEAFARQIAVERSLDFSWQVVQDEASVECDPELTARLRTASTRLALPDVPLTSGAGHDAVIMAGVVPVAMLFVRCAGGISHHPDESVRAEDIAAALAVMNAFLESFCADQIA